MIDSGQVGDSLPPPGSEAWHRLLQGLLHAQEMREACDGSDAERSAQWSTIDALGAVLRYLKSSPTIISSELEAPLWSLLGALLSVEQGASPKQFERANSGKKPGKSIERLGVEWNAALAIDELKDHGMLLDRAAERVAASVEKTGVQPRHNATLANTVKGWRYSLRAQSSTAYRDQLRQSRLDYSRQHGKAGSPIDRATYLLRLIKNVNLKLSEKA